LNYSKKNIELTRVEIGKAVKCFIDNGGVIEKIEYREPHFLWGNNPIREERLYPMAYSKSQ
jgi:hypothetical protein